MNRYTDKTGNVFEAMQWRGHSMEPYNIEYIVDFEIWFERIAPNTTLRYKGNDLYNSDGRFLIAKPSDWIVAVDAKNWSAYTDDDFRRQFAKVDA